MDRGEYQKCRESCGVIDLLRTNAHLLVLYRTGNPIREITRV